MKMNTSVQNKTNCETFRGPMALATMPSFFRLCVRKLENHQFSVRFSAMDVIFSKFFKCPQSDQKKTQIHAIPI